MNDNEFDELSKTERQQFESLPRKKEPPSFLEENLVEILKKKNIIRQAGNVKTINYYSFLTGFAVVVIILAVGFGLGIWWKPKPDTIAENNRPEFILLLRSTLRQEKNITESEEKRLVEEYSAWAGKISSEEFLLEGEKLKTEARVLNKNNENQLTINDLDKSSDDLVVGYFKIKAESYSQAMSIAGECPHLKYGGKVEVREIDHFQ